MNSVRTEGIGARSGAIARVQFGKPSPYLALMSEVRWQLLTLEAAVALARATVAEPVGQTRPEVDTHTLLKAAALVEAIDAAVTWASASEGWPPRFYSDTEELTSWLLGDDFEDSTTNLEEARKQAEAALDRFDQFEESNPDALAARPLLTAVFEAASAAEKLALGFHAALRDLREQLASNPPDAVKRDALLVLERAKEVRLQIKNLTGERAAVQRAAVALLPRLAYGPNEDLPILRIKQESPLEVVVILIGSAGAIVAVLNGLLDVKIKYNTRKMKERAARSRLERELAEDEAKMEAITRLRKTLARNEPERLRIQHLTVFDSLEEAFEDDEEMKAT